MTIKDPYLETVKKSPNFRGKINPRFIVLHHSYGSFVGTVSWCLQRKSGVSYHYVIDPTNGDRVQLVYDTDRAWHAGVSRWNGLNGMNSYSVGIAFAGDTNSRTPADYEIDSCAHKCLYLMNKFPVISIQSIITHRQIAPERKNDCSRETHALVLRRIKELTK